MAEQPLFVHHCPALRNIGDELCSPRHYFSFSGARGRLAIVGGGVFSDLGAKALQRARIPATAAILWGVGRSLKRAGQSLHRIETLPNPAWGLRDIDGVADPRHFLPCVSCLHPMLDQPITGDGTLLFINADARVTPPAVTAELGRLAAAQHWQFLQNDCSDAEMAQALQSCRRVITNSFHGTYWALLSGHETRVMGYSTKFRSLLQTFGLSPAALNRYEKPRKLRHLLAMLGLGSTGLVEQARAMVHQGEFLRLPDNRAVLADFRARNLAFAAELVAKGLFDAVTPTEITLAGSRPAR